MLAIIAEYLQHVSGRTVPLLSFPVHGIGSRIEPINQPVTHYACVLWGAGIMGNRLLLSGMRGDASSDL